MTKRQASILIALVAVLILVVVGVGAALIMRGSGDAGTVDVAADDSGTAETTEIASATTAVEDETVDPVTALKDAGLDVVLPPPVPEAPEQWGDYRLHDSWENRTRVFEGSPTEALRGPDQGRFPATQNACGIVTYFVTFRAVNPDATLNAQLKDAIDDVVAEDGLNSGWMLGTNCATPYVGLAELPGEGTLTDVVYTVHEYRQSSVAQDRQPEQEPAAPPVTSTPPALEPTPTQAAPAPVLVECQILGLGPPQGRYSDGVVRGAPECQNHPDYQRMVEAEGVCGGLYGWMEVTAERYLELCGVPPPTYRVPPTQEHGEY